MINPKSGEAWTPTLDTEAARRALGNFAQATREAADAFRRLTGHIHIHEAMERALHPDGAAVDRAVAALSGEERNKLAQAVFRLRSALDRAKDLNEMKVQKP